jgi:hypothetical protein
MLLETWDGKELSNKLREIEALVKMTGESADGIVNVLGEPGCVTDEPGAGKK